MKLLADRACGKPIQKLDGELRVPLAIVHRSPPRDPLALEPDDERTLEMNRTRALPPAGRTLDAHRDSR